MMTTLGSMAAAAGIGDIAEKVFQGQRLSREDGVRLYHADLHAVGALANWVREEKHGDLTYFNVNQHINYTNVCNKLCRFCAFQRLPGQEGAYVMKPEEVAEKIAAQLHEPVTEVHMVAGIYPKLPYEYYLDILRAAKEVRPSIHIKAFTMIELMQIARRAKKPLAEVLPELIEAGLGSCPGGGAEVFSDRVRDLGYDKKNTGTEWLDTARTVHEAGLRSNCTMLHGHIETIEERVDHHDRLRKLQDETGGFQTYIPLSFHPANTEWSHLPGPTAMDELREIAVSRLLLDNIDHIKAYWIMLSIPVAQMALSFGSDDVDGTVVEEKIYHEAGATTPQEVKRNELVQWIRDAGRIPVERDTLYNVIWSADENLARVGAAAPVATVGAS
ncbi:Aminodeoxyfutalosine synthase [Planctomycetes bacterium Poly30]|uniref:Aminodeoxyfutalosine synthase n=1 Tax=Saltatorellus ferox TaxID=2528018 RepID=A0A518EX53_9BACT|nr:Aminodeoxyfutalosine synthase [Planctomycetes bacterium Poly30]